eukprot:COSAG05_NODE_37_length_27688_cov_18.080394_22_plen_144_part_00
MLIETNSVTVGLSSTVQVLLRLRLTAHARMLEELQRIVYKLLDPWLVLDITALPSADIIVTVAANCCVRTLDCAHFSQLQWVRGGTVAACIRGTSINHVLNEHGRHAGRQAGRQEGDLTSRYRLAPRINAAASLVARHCYPAC